MRRTLMSTAKHTPGPWHVQKSDHPGGLLIKPVPGQVVAQCDELPEMEANAHLIAAAPDLLRVCKDAFKTELTPIGEQFVIPGCEKAPTPSNKQGTLWD